MKKACVLGCPVEHSLSPHIHGYWLEQYGIDGLYEKIHTEPDALAETLKILKSNGYAGCNLTIPHKETCMQYLDIIDNTARAIGAVNTVWIDEDGMLNGTNTDAFGFIENMKSKSYAYNKNKAVILGAGGAARAVVYALAQDGFKEIAIINRTESRAEQLADDFADLNGSHISATSWSEIGTEIENCDLLVNTTSLGMKGQAALDLDLSTMKQGIVYDIVYAPLMTALLVQAEAQGLKAITGLGMLLHQARPGFEHWFGKMPEVTPELERLLLEKTQ